jgi:hypothetical protein
MRAIVRMVPDEIPLMSNENLISVLHNLGVLAQVVLPYAIATPGQGWSLVARPEYLSRRHRNDGDTPQFLLNTSMCGAIMNGNP